MENKIKLKTLFAGTAYPYRGGIASFNELLARTMQQRGDKVDISTFTLQYPSFLFPGKSQYSEKEAPEDLSIKREINSINPFNWIACGIKFFRRRYDVLFLRYWSPYMSPCLATIAYITKLNRHTKIIALADNITPHENHFYDNILTKYFTCSVDGFIVMSKEVLADLRKFSDKPALLSPHPIYMNYGDPISKQRSCNALKLDPEMRYALFFGFVRKYKGLDLLLKAWAIHKSHKNSDKDILIVAGEYYVDKDQYTTLIDELSINNSVIIEDNFIPDEKVKEYFCAADMVVQPYKSATQSGVTQIAYHFGIPMIVTDVGGLPEIVPDNKVGYVVPQDISDIALAIDKCFDSDNNTRFRENIKSEKKRFSWDAMSECFDNLYLKIK